VSEVNTARNHQIRSGDGERMAALDGLRGIAAMVVVLRHLFNAVAMPLEIRMAVLHSPLALILNGQGAVQLFFVLSGFVLAASLERGTASADILQFYLKRIARVHVPYAFGLLFAWIASTAYPNNGIDGLSTFFGRFTVVHLEFRELLRFMLFPGDAALQLPVGWTLGVEMLFSLLMPLMVLVASRTHWSVLLVGSSGLLFAYP
jgi:peptidoglycan/LPS O-acetylase OafA/YrhL